MPLLCGFLSCHQTLLSARLLPFGRCTTLEMLCKTILNRNKTKCTHTDCIIRDDKWSDVCASESIQKGFCGNLWTTPQYPHTTHTHTYNTFQLSPLFQPNSYVVPFLNETKQEVTEEIFWKVIIQYFSVLYGYIAIMS